MMNKPWMAGVLLACLVSPRLQASTDEDFSNEPLVQRCMKMLDIYAAEDFDAYIAEFPEPWLGIFGEKTLRKILSERHQGYVETYQQDRPDTIKIRSVESADVAKLEQERLGATEAKEVEMYMSNNVGGGHLTACKYLLIGDRWYFRSLRI
ncbi:hypothetical protein FCL40_03155 [Ferrimonas sediminicola]|uniref:SnoaL-like domain-containing protein n=1 Tax=Ferrimonas sediminicola TaxID=2569538 RepID=A0A4U1BN80_9GAMM|nr:hypothetical protein [Ferrimonas sediminicola]TKB51568.1 hypothetical protein FCL40_03155 [Ferrimonas sediminicola]